MTTSGISSPATVEETEGVVRRPHGPAVMAVVAGLLVAAIVAGVAIGPMRLEAIAVVEIIASRLGIGDADAYTTAEINVVWDIRFPRVLLAALVGSALAVCGAALQGLFGNSLADPGVIGVTAGASLGAITAIVLGLTVFGSWTDRKSVV